MFVLSFCLDLCRVGGGAQTQDAVRSTLPLFPVRSEKL